MICNKAEVIVLLLPLTFKCDVSWDILQYVTAGGKQLFILEPAAQPAAGAQNLCTLQTGCIFTCNFALFSSILMPHG